MQAWRANEYWQMHQYWWRQQGKQLFSNFNQQGHQPKSSVLSFNDPIELANLLKNASQKGKEHINYDLSEFNRDNQILKINKFYSEIINNY